jgi:hypothetical protein
MKIINMRVLFFISLAAACTTAGAQAAGSTLTIEGKKLTLQMHAKCPQPRPLRKELVKYLAQYDPRQEEGLTAYDEDRPFTENDVKEIRDSLVQFGFTYPNGNASVITWIDFDGDGICDFTTSAGIGGMRPIDRMFLFRGLPNGKFQLIDSDLSYMDSSIALLPYIPIKVSGERLPVIVTSKSNRMLQWQSDSHQLASCEMYSEPTYTNLSKKPGQPASALELLCPHIQEIVAWAEKQLPDENAALYWGDASR